MPTSSLGELFICQNAIQTQRTLDTAHLTTIIAFLKLYIFTVFHDLPSPPQAQLLEGKDHNSSPLFSRALPARAHAHMAFPITRSSVSSVTLFQKLLLLLRWTSRQALLYPKVTPQATPLNFLCTTLYEGPAACLEDSGNGSCTLAIQLSAPGMFTCPTKASRCLISSSKFSEHSTHCTLPHPPPVASLSPP